MRASSWSSVTCFAALALGCAGNPGLSSEADEDVGEVQSALNDGGLTTPYGAKTAVAAAHDHILTVWTANDSAGKTQIAGRAFATNGNTFGLNPQLVAYSNGINPKSSPAAAWDRNIGTFLVVWQDDFSTTDSDIWGAITTDDGRLQTSPFHVNFDSLNEKNPTVVHVPENDNKYLVVYTRTSGSTTTLSGNWVDEFGNVDVTMDLESGVNPSASRPTASHDGVFGNILLTWNDNQLAFADSIGLSLGTAQTISGANSIVSAANSNNGVTAVAWRTGSGTSTKIKAQTFSGGCELLVCATSPVNLISAGGSVTGLNPPVLAANGGGFGAFAGDLPASIKKLQITTLGSNGSVGINNSSVAPVCGGSLQGGGSLGLSGSMAVATPPDSITDREFLLYDAFCATSPNQAKEHVVAPAANVFDVLHFTASN